MQGNHDTLNPPVADINSQPGSDATIRVSASSTGNVRRTSDGSYTMKVSASALICSHADSKQSLKNCKLLPPLPGYRTYRVFECVITIVHNARSYVVDITGNIGAQAIRECIFEELRIPDNLRSNLAIYCAGPGSVIVGSALDNNQLLIECLRFGDDSGSLGFVAQYIDTLLGTITTSENMFNHLGQPPPDRSTAASIRMPQPMISSNHGALLSQHMPSRRVMVAATHDTYNYIVIDLTGYMDGQAVRERILSMVWIKYLPSTSPQINSKY
ncbi:hypothetical protein FRC09_004784 [Ceratobasidium sp. 395]|nr:hypothetical protein FRC09_004784 [Ceratobasidium sp. 395]